MFQWLSNVRAGVFVILLTFPDVHNRSAEVPAVISAFKASRRNLEVLTVAHVSLFIKKASFPRILSSRSLPTSGARG